GVETGVSGGVARDRAITGSSGTRLPMNPLTEAVSSALLHFVWQGLVVASLLWVALSLMRGCSANARYVASCAALVVQAALPVLTTLLLYSSPPDGGTAFPGRLAVLTPHTTIDWQSWELRL